MGCSADSDSNSRIDGVGGSLAIFALSGNYLYTVDESKLNVFSLLNQNEPVKVNDIPIGWNIETLFANGDKLYIGSRNGMFIYSIANPENPVKLSEAQHFTACDPVVANDTHSFVTLHSNTNCGNNLNVLMVYETTDATNPQLIHQRNLVSPKGLGLYDNYLFVCDDVIKIFDVRNPENPVLVKSLNVQAFDVIITGNNLFTIGENDLQRFSLNPSDVNDIEHLSQINF
ncbi:hypothetical protein GV828_04865 [Flavobacterium sp. NST-5]|uniref:LVIVD repeat-containing protein n=2 Tax=Flavobacterium ichthyis TaxID=2698827 RepID=A0ABW9ZBQ8_9FLAO|nr:hypothetical protein [Flavobacterium ichthyis]